MGFQLRRPISWLAAVVFTTAIVFFAPGAAVHAAPNSIQITKTPDNATVSAGDPIGYKIVVSNQSRARANIFVTDALPTNAGTSWVMQPTIPNCSIAAGGGTLQCAAVLAAGAIFSVHIVSPTTRDTCGQGSARMVSVTNTASVSSNLGNTTSLPATITVNCPRLQVTKAADYATVNAGDQVSYRIDAHNIGNGNANGFTLTDTLPGNLNWTLDSSASDPSCAINLGQLTCTPPSFPGGAALSARIVATASPQDCGQISNTALVAATNAFPSSAGPVPITINCPHFDLQKVADTPTVNAGDPVGYRLILTNRGPGDAYNTTLTDVLPNGLSWSLDPLASDPSCSVMGGQMLSCAPPNALLAGQQIMVHVTATSSTANCPSISNSANATSSNGGQAFAGPVSITINCQPDLIIQSIAFNSTPYASSYSYTVTVKNQGSGTANLGGVPVQGYFSPTKDDWSGDPACGNSFNPGTLAAGATTTITVACSSPPVTGGDNWLVVKVNYDNHIAESDTTNNVTSLALPVQLALTKTADQASVTVGDQVGYSIHVQNTGTPTADGVTVTDSLPSGLTWTMSSSDATCALSTSGGGQILTCGPEQLPLGGTVDAHVVATTSTANCPSISNSATASATNGSTVSTQAVTINITCPPDLVVQSIAFTPSTAYTDGYTVKIKNQGGGTANLGGVLVDGIYASSPGGSPPIGGACGFTIPNGTTLAPGATFDFPIGCSLGAPAGDAWLVVTVDDGNVLPESDETNNVGSVSLFDGSVVDDGLCSFTATATWHNSSPDRVTASWYVDGVFKFIEETPTTGTITGNTATFNVGPATPTGPAMHAWQVRLTFFNGPVNDGDVYTNIDSVACGV